MQIGPATTENKMEVLLKIKAKTTMWPRNFISRYFSGKKTHKLKNIYIPMFIAALFTIAKIQKQPK